MFKDTQPPFPELLDCPCIKEECALNGCFFENAIKRINPNKLGVEKAYLVEDELISMAQDCRCKKYKELIAMRVKR